MFAVSEIVPGGLPAGQSQTQAQMIASVIALQRVIAGQAGAESGDAAANNFAGNNERAKTVRTAERMKQREDTGLQRPAAEVAQPTRSAAAQSIVEAQEAAMTDRMIVAAFQARHGISDLLSVIRDPDDRLLPRAPEQGGMRSE